MYVVNDTNPKPENTGANLASRKMQTRVATRKLFPTDRKWGDVINHMMDKILDRELKDNLTTKWVRNLVRLEGRVNSSVNILEDMVNMCLENSKTVRVNLGKLKLPATRQ